MVVVTQKIVSKAEGRVADLRGVEPSDRARDFALTWEKDARAVGGHPARGRPHRPHGGRRAHHGDAPRLRLRTPESTPPTSAGAVTTSCCSPLDPDASARRIRDALLDAAGAEVAVIVSDTFGRPWREGAINVAIGCAGIEPLLDYRGDVDSDGRELRSTVIAVADEIAAASELVMHKLHRVPAAIVRGYPYEKGDSASAPWSGERGKDLFPLTRSTCHPRGSGDPASPVRHTGARSERSREVVRGFDQPPGDSIG